MKINFFDRGSPLYPFRWFILISLAIIGTVAYADNTGWRILSFGSQQQWNASGQGFHK
ncbi:hypothetical protein V9K67_01780 [Paraflavisolibacter sp. H34]|uniref:hypothetical protein n=1 Tax=Huijunlia imazamoxiresistens TaxID=3127457 RepID=UPI003017FD7F